MGKLDDVPQNATAVMVDLAAPHVGGDTLNGPEDRLDWDTIKWRDQEAQVQRLRQRIFKATQAGDLETGPQSAETHVAQPGQRAGQHAPGHPAHTNE